METRKFNVLFLSKSNEGRSIIAEALLNHWGKDKFNAYSAGTQPSGSVHPMALAVLKQSHLVAENDYHSKPISEFETDDAPDFDFVITVCDSVQGEKLPNWSGQPISAKWNIEQPEESAAEDTYTRSFMCLQNRIQAFSQLRMESLDRLSRQQALDALADLKP